MQELRGQELSLPGVQELRSLAGQRFRRPGVQQEARSSGAQLFRKTGVSGANRSGGQEFLRLAVQGSGRRPGDGSEFARGARSSNSSLRSPKVEIKLDASSARVVVGCKSSQWMDDDGLLGRYSKVLRSFKKDGR